MGLTQNGLFLTEWSGNFATSSNANREAPFSYCGLGSQALRSVPER
jgi:hypothetical protein